VIGNRKQGLGHVTRVMTLMEMLTGHVTRAFCTPDQDLAIARLTEALFPVEVVAPEDMRHAIDRFGPDVIVHDELDTDPAVIADEAERCRVVCFEDSGGGLAHAHLVFNALYDPALGDPAAGQYFGSQAYILRDEFLHAARGAVHDRVGTVLVTFGGTDPSGLTLRVLDALQPVCRERVVVVAGKGLSDFDGLERRVSELVAGGMHIELHRDVALMSEVMASADLAFSSAGRTLYELAHMHVPTVVLAQNQIELLHTFGRPENGFLWLGLGNDVESEAIASAYSTLQRSPALVSALRKNMSKHDLTRGRELVLRKIMEIA
jgi:spore coat polysaccharide biosynthesis predicted glycosyltransferase SpsG